MGEELSHGSAAGDALHLAACWAGSQWETVGEGRAGGTQVLVQQ